MIKTINKIIMENNKNAAIGLGILIGFLATVYMLQYPSIKKDPTEMSRLELKQLLKTYVEQENYEKAATVRDLLKITK